MKGFVRRKLAALVASAALPAAAAGSYTYTDLWWNPQQAGWGANIVQQGDVAFVTLYVHGADGRPTWYFASDARIFATDASGRPAFRGPLYAATGPWIGAPFDPANVATRLAGHLVIEPRPGGELLLEYTADGVNVSRHVQRYSFALPQVGGSYNAAFTLRVSQLGLPPTGTREFRAGIEAMLDGSEFSMRIAEDVGVCQYRGTWASSGRMARVAGTYECAAGTAGSFSIDELEVTEHAFSGYIRMQHQGVEQYGRFAAARR